MRSTEMKEKIPTVFKHFQGKYADSERCHCADDEAISHYEEILPKKLLQLWREAGWCQYAHGLFQVDNPTNYKDVLEAWLGDEAESTYVIGRTAFGDLFLWKNNEIQLLSAVYSKIFEVTDNLFIFFSSTLCSESYLEKVLNKDIFDQARERLGTPNRDECYAFVPALALGGTASAKNVERVKFKEHSLFLAQLQRDDSTNE